MLQQRLGRLEPAGARHPRQRVGLPVTLHVGDRDDLDLVAGAPAGEVAVQGDVAEPDDGPAQHLLEPVFERHHAQRLVEDGQPGRAPAPR